MHQDFLTVSIITSSSARRARHLKRVPLLLKEVINPCRCGRSPTGDCIGWHSLTNEEFKVRLDEWYTSSGKQLLSENSGIDKA
jgi:hypothetical protein